MRGMLPSDVQVGNRHTGHVRIFALLLVLLGACEASDPRVDSASPSAFTRDVAPLFQTDSLSYVLRDNGSAYVGIIGVTLTNRTGGPVYIVNCNGIASVNLQKRFNSSEWQNVWSPVSPACLSPPITVRAGETHRISLGITGGHPGSSIFPQFSTDQIEGEYRILWRDVLSSYRDRAPFGDTLPLESRISNRFMISLGPIMRQ
jgi:hypothetical protein